MNESRTKLFGHLWKVAKIRTRKLLLLCVLAAAAISFSCNSPFAPIVNLTPRLVVYSVLFANSKSVYVRVTAVTGSQGADISKPVHGAAVVLSDMTGNDVTLTDTTAMMNGDSISFYYAQMKVVPYKNYQLSVEKNGYLPAIASVSVPGSNVTVPSSTTFGILRKPDGLDGQIGFDVLLSGSTRGEFARLFVEYRGFDSSGTFASGIIPVSSQATSNPFSEVTPGNITAEFAVSDYASAFNYVSSLAGRLKQVHFYAVIVVTQIDDALYRFYITSNRGIDPLAMRTDKIIFTNIFGQDGAGIVAGASVDTTRIFLY